MLWIKRLIVALIGLAKAGAAKASAKFEPMLITTLSVISAAAAPGAVLDNMALLLWLLTGSACGACFVLFGDEKKALTPRAIASKLSVCFIPGFCLTGIGVKLGAVIFPDKAWAQPSAELVLATALILSVAGPMVVAKLVKKTGDKIDGAIL